jgi:hypothetical protein
MRYLQPSTLPVCSSTIITVTKTTTVEIITVSIILISILQITSSIKKIKTKSFNPVAIIHRQTA